MFWGPELSLSMADGTDGEARDPWPPRCFVAPRRQRDVVPPSQQLCIRGPRQPSPPIHRRSTTGIRATAFRHAAATAAARAGVATLVHAAPIPCRWRSVAVSGVLAVVDHVQLVARPPGPPPRAPATAPAATPNVEAALAARSVWDDPRPGERYPADRLRRGSGQACASLGRRRRPSRPHRSAGSGP